MSKKNSSQGLSIIEVIFAILLIFLLLSGLVSAMVFTVKAARFSRNKSTGIQIAKQELENVKGQRDDTWWADKAARADPGPLCDGLTSLGEDYSQFKKNICYKDYLGDAVKKQVTVIVSVYWGDKNVEVAKLSSILTDWDQ